MLTAEDSFLEPFINGTIKAFKNLCNLETRVEQMGPSSEFEPLPLAIAGIIGITGAKFHGAMTIGFPKEVFLFVMNLMLGEGHDEITPELADGAAELSNIILGQAKVPLNEAGHEIQMALPSVVMGAELGSGSPLSKEGVTIRLSTPAGPVVIEFACEAVSASNAAAEPVPAPPAGGAVQESPKLDGQVLLSFVDGIRKTLKVQCEVEARAGSPFLKTSDKHYSFAIAGVIGVTGASFSGTFAMCFEDKVFLNILSQMLGEPITALAKEHEDAAAELVNIVFGVSKTVLNAKGYALQVAIPTIVRGVDIQSLYPSRKPPIVLPFEAPGGRFWVEFAFEALDKGF